MRLLLLLVTLAMFTACDAPFGGQQYLPAGSGVDPYQNARAQAEKFYQEGLAAESEGHLVQALNDFRQARLWDHDGRQDIQTALSRAEAKTNGPSAAKPTPTSAIPGIALRPFHSHAFPYSISVPEDWATKQDVTSDHPVDTFTRPASSTSNVVMLITVDDVKSGTTLDQLYVASKQSLEAEGVSGVQIVDRRLVGDQPAYVLSYRASIDSNQASVFHAIFVTPSHAWHIILLASPATTPELVKIFDAMLDSVTFEASAFPAL